MFGSDANMIPQFLQVAARVGGGVTSAVAPTIVASAPSSLAASSAKGAFHVLSLAVSSTIRGGGGTAMLDHSAAVATYFGDIRTPAMLIVGASIAALFDNTVEMAKRNNKAERLCIRTYNVCVMLSFMLSLYAIVTATAAGVMVLRGEFNPLALSAYELLQREFLFEFSSVRLSYLMSLLSFVVGVTSRALLEYNLLRKGRGDTAMALSLAMGSLILYLGSYINSTMGGNLWSMSMTVLSTILHRIIHHRGPLQLASIACLILSAGFIGRGTCRTIRLEDTKND